MTKQEIETRIAKKENDIQKIEKRIVKWTAGMNEEAKALCAACEVRADDPQFKSVRASWGDYKKAHADDPTVYRQDYNFSKGPNFDEAYTAYRDLAEQKATLEKYKVQLDKIDNFTSMEKIPSIWNFLQEWRKNAYEFFVENVKLYTELRKNEEQKYKEYQESEEYKNLVASYGDKWSISWKTRYYYKWKEKYYDQIASLTKDIYMYNGKWDEAKLNKTLDKDVQFKYEDFVRRITEKAGIIQDAAGLKIAGNGTINGYVIGDKHTVKVETILAGGYNIQRLHYRVLVNITK